EHGNSDGSCFAYAMLSLVAGPHFGNFQAGFRFGQLGYDLIERRGLRRFQALTYLALGQAILPLTRHVRAGREMARRAFEAANKIGDLTCAVYCGNQLNAHLLADGDPLAETQREAENGLAFAQKMRFGYVIDVISTQLGLIRTLRGLTRKFGSLDDEQFRSEEHTSELQSRFDLVCRLLLEKKKHHHNTHFTASVTASALLIYPHFDFYSVIYNCSTPTFESQL